MPGARQPDLRRGTTSIWAVPAEAPSIGQRWPRWHLDRQHRAVLEHQLDAYVSFDLRGSCPHRQHVKSSRGGARWRLGLLQQGDRHSGRKLRCYGGVSIQSVIVGHGVFPMPIGPKGVAMVDARDIADIAVAELLRRDRTAGPLPRVTLDVAGREVFTGESATAVWSKALGRPIHYGGDDVEPFETQLVQNRVPAWMAYDLRLMMARIQQVGQIPTEGAVQKLEQMLGRPMRSYQDFVAELLKKGT